MLILVLIVGVVLALYTLVVVALVTARRRGPGLIVGVVLALYTLVVVALRRRHVLARVGHAADRREIVRLEGQLGRVYYERNLAAAALARLALLVGWRAGLYDDPESPGWPVCSVLLPQGEVTWHLTAAPSGLPRIERAWDGHTAADRDLRLEAFVGGGAVLRPGDEVSDA